MEATMVIVIGLITVILSLLVQTGAMCYWAGTISRTVKHHGNRLNDLEEAHPRDHT